MHRKPKTQRDDKKKLKTQIDKYRGNYSMQFIIKSESRRVPHMKIKFTR